MKLQVFGDYVFEFLLITFLLIGSLVLIIPFVPMLVGINGYFKKDIHSRKYRDIFINIRDNWKILIFYTIFELIILLASGLNIYYINTNPEVNNNFILVISYIALIFGIVYLITGPTIIINMNVTLKQLIYNGFMLLLGNLKNSILAILMVAVMVILILYFPYIVIFGFYFILLFNQKLMIENFYKLKAIALGVKVEDVRPKENKDDFFDDK